MITEIIKKLLKGPPKLRNPLYKITATYWSSHPPALQPEGHIDRYPAEPGQPDLVIVLKRIQFERVVEPAKDSDWVPTEAFNET
jgi:hypothetical protein